MAEVSQTHALVLFMLLAELRQDAPHGLVAVVVVFELLQGGQQRVPTAFSNTDREHDEEAVKPCLFHNHTVLGQELGDDAGWNTCVVKLTVQI